MDLTFNLVAQQVFTGLALGAIYVLVAVGISLIFGMLTVVNFAHGAFYMVGAYVGAHLYGLTGSFLLSLVVTPLVIGTIGMAAERWLVRPLYGRGIDYPLLLTFGLSYVLVDAIRILFGIEGMEFGTPGSLAGAANIGIGMFPLYRLWVIGVTALLLLGLWLFIEKTRFGLIIRAGSRDPVILRVLGVDVAGVWLVIFGLGTALAGLAGLMAAPIRGVTPEMGQPVLIEAFVVTVIGGMGSLPGAVLAGLAVGITVSMTTLIRPEWAELSIFVLMALTLLLRPHGMLGRAGLMS